MVENEAYFRQQNERVRHNFEAIIKMAEESNQEYLIPSNDSKLSFYCECSDEDCVVRVQLRPSVYQRIHQNRRKFVLVPGHETAKVDRVVARRREYWVVEKPVTPPETGLSLNETDINND